MAAKFELFFDFLDFSDLVSCRIRRRQQPSRSNESLKKANFDYETSNPKSRQKASKSARMVIVLVFMA